MDVSLQQKVTSHNTVLLKGCNRGFPDQTCVGMSQNQWPSKPIDLIDYFRSQFLGPGGETHSLIDFALYDYVMDVLVFDS